MDGDPYNRDEGFTLCGSMAHIATRADVVIGPYSEIMVCAFVGNESISKGRVAGDGDPYGGFGGVCV